MNEAIFFKTADYTKNKNLVIDEDTVYEVDPVCKQEQNQKDSDTVKDSCIQENDDDIVLGIDTEYTNAQNIIEMSRPGFFMCRCLIILILGLMIVRENAGDRC